VNVGDLVKKRWGKIEPWEQGTAGLVVGYHVHAHTNPAFTGRSIKVRYPNQPIRYYREDEFIAIKRKNNV
jgi:hypothetical protein